MEGRLNSESEMYMQKAVESIGAARNLVDGGFFCDAISKSYYCMFYASQALLIKHHIARKKHSAVISAIGEHFVKSGKLSRTLHRHLINAFEDREIADYDVTWFATEDDAKLRIEQAREFIDEIQVLLKS